MDVSQITEGLNSIGLIAYAILTTIAAGAGIYKAVKNWRNANSVNIVLENTEDALKSVVLGIEATRRFYKDDPKMQAKIDEIERTIQSISSQVGDRDSTLNEAVKLLKALLPDAGSSPDMEALRARAVEAAKKAREIKTANGTKGKTVAKKAGIIGGIFAALFLLSSCCEPCQQRLTDETLVIEADGTATLVVEYPAGVVADDIINLDINGRAESVAPLPRE